MENLNISNRIETRRGLSKMVNDEFDRLFDAVYAEYKLRNQRKAQNAANKLYLGARVVCTDPGPRLARKVLIVDKINTKNVKCHIEGNPNQKWNITATLLELA